MLNSEDSRLRLSGAEILASAGNESIKQAVPQLLKAVEDHRGFDSWPSRIAAAELLVNDLHHSEDAINTLVSALEYGANPLVVIPNATEVRKMAVLALGKLKSEEQRSGIAEKLIALLQTERDPEVLDSLYQALLSLESAPA
jgi:HEAT repeat protein